MAGVIEEAWSYWETIRGDDIVPLRARLDPVDIPGLLSCTILVDVLFDPLDFRYRLIGTGMDELSAHRLTGRRFSEIPHIEPDGRLWSDHETVVRTRMPLMGTVTYEGPNEFVRAMRHGLFPLSGDGRTVNKIWCVCEVSRAQIVTPSRRVADRAEPPGR